MPINNYIYSDDTFSDKSVHTAKEVKYNYCI